MGLLAIEVEEFWHWWTRRVVCGWLSVGAGVFLASSGSRGCEAELCVLPVSHLVDYCSVELVVVRPQTGFYSVACDLGSPPVSVSVDPLVPGLVSALTVPFLESASVRSHLAAHAGGRCVACRGL